MTDQLLLYSGVALTVVGLFAAWFSCLLGLPGTWVMVGIAALHSWLVPDDSRCDISWNVVFVLIGLAVIGEVIESGLSAVGVKRLGGSWRGMVLAFFGSLGGAIIGGMIGVPVPVIGSLIGIILGAGLGALAGAALGELWKGRTLEESLQVGHAAFWGRLMGSMAKLIVASIMLAIALTATFVTWG